MAPTLRCRTCRRARSPCAGRSCAPAAARSPRSARWRPTPRPSRARRRPPRPLGLGSGAVVLSYESVPGEPPTAALHDALVARGVRVLVPDTLADLDLDWHDLADPGAPASPRRPAPRRPRPRPRPHGRHRRHADGAGRRLLRQGAPPRRAGVPVVVLLHPGELDDAPLPREEHDVPVDAVLTADAGRPPAGRARPLRPESWSGAARRAVRAQVSNSGSVASTAPP